MKKQLNIICILVFLSLGFSLLPHIYAMGTGFVAGFKEGWNETRVLKRGLSETTHRSPVELFLMPDFGGNVIQLENLKTGKMLDVQMVSAIVWTDQNAQGIPSFIFAILEFIYIVTIVWAVISFYKLINTINHQIIFDWINVRRLNKLGILLLISAVIVIIINLLNYYSVAEDIVLDGHSINFFEVFNTINLILGLIALLVGRIFAMGIRLREEQELTI